MSPSSFDLYKIIKPQFDRKSFVKLFKYTILPPNSRHHKAKFEIAYAEQFQHHELEKLHE